MFCTCSESKSVDGGQKDGSVAGHSGGAILLLIITLSFVRVIILVVVGFGSGILIIDVSLKDSRAGGGRHPGSASAFNVETDEIEFDINISVRELDILACGIYGNKVSLEMSVEILTC